MNNALKILAATLLLASSSFGKTLLFKNGVIHTVSGADIPNGQVLVTDGKITSVSAADQNASADETIDLKGEHLFPGLINAAGWLGLVEISGVRSTRDMSEVGQFTPEIQAWKSVNPDSDLLAVARANGITHTVAVPGGGIISGQSGLMQTAGGWTFEDLTAKSPLAMHLFWPSMVLDTRRVEGPGEKPKPLEEQAKDRRLRVKQIDDFFAEAESYAALQKPDTARVPSWEAMVPVIRGEIPLVIHADGFQQIRAVIKFAQEHEKYRIVLSGGRDSWRFARDLATRKIAVIFERVFNDGSPDDPTDSLDVDPYDVHFHAPAVLAEAGVKVAITVGLSSMEASNVRNDPYLAAHATAFGLSHADALKSISLNVAEIYGVADRLGSIDSGKEANFFTATGDALDARTHVTSVWIKGQKQSLQNKQTRLWEKYRNRPLPTGQH